MRALLFCAAALLSACDSYHYHAGRFLYATGGDLKALAQFERFLNDAPRDPRAAEVQVLAGRVDARLQRCLEARRHFEAAARDFPDSQPWARLAKAGIMDCPDYFPLEKGYLWTYGDSASGGKAMLQTDQIQGFGDFASASILDTLFAGQKEIRSAQLRYVKEGWGVWEIRGDEKALVLRYPFRKGESWSTTRGGEKLEYRIVSDDARVETAAGAFTGCLKVREYNPKFPGTWKYDYFAPFVGRVKTSVAGPDYENPNTELIRFVR